MPDRLRHGVQRFHANVLTQERDYLRRIASDQEPHTLFIGCADSRVVPNDLTQQGPGELFVIRNAGNIVPAHGNGGGEAASIEFALEALPIEDIVVCGHTDCGAVKAIVEPSKADKLPAVRAWLEHSASVGRLIDQEAGSWTPEKRLRFAIEENVLAQLEHLETLPSVVAAMRRRAETGRKLQPLKLHAWVYDLSTGRVTAYDPDSGLFAPLGDPPAA